MRINGIANFSITNHTRTPNNKINFTSQSREEVKAPPSKPETREERAEYYMSYIRGINYATASLDTTIEGLSLSDKDADTEAKTVLTVGALATKKATLLDTKKKVIAELSKLDEKLSEEKVKFPRTPHLDRDEYERAMEAVNMVHNENLEMMNSKITD